MQENKCLADNRAGVAVPVVDVNRCEGKGARVVCSWDVFKVRKIDKEDFRGPILIGKVKN